jgi:hypothetical protein
MKKLLTVLLIFSAALASAQPLMFGPKAGLNITSIEMKNVSFGEGTEYSYTTQAPGIGIVAGAYLRMSFSNFYVQPELLYAQDVSNMLLRTPAFNIDQKVAINKIDIPVLLGYHYNDFRVFGGPVLNLLLDASALPSKGNAIALRGGSSRDQNYGFQLGVGYDFPRFTLDVKYEHCLKGMDMDLWLNNVPLQFEHAKKGLQATLGYRIHRD